MEPSDDIRHSKSIGFGVILIGLLILTTFIPAKWLGVKPVLHTRLDLNAINVLGGISSLSEDADKNNNPDWRDLVNSDFNNKVAIIETIKSTPIDPSAQKRLDDPNNITASLSKNLYISSSYLEKNGVNDPQTEQEILDHLLAEESTKLATTTYSYKDLFIATKETKETLKSYGNSVAKIIEGTITEKIITSDITAVGKFADKRNAVDLIPLITNKKRVDTILFKLLNISVPQSVASYHLLALNRIADYRNMIDNLSKADTDPVRATLVIKQYSNITILVLRLNSQFSDYFNSKNIVFSAKDAGYVFTSGYTTNK